LPWEIPSTSPDIAAADILTAALIRPSSAGVKQRLAAAPLMRA